MFERFLLLMDALVLLVDFFVAVNAEICRWIECLLHPL